MTLLAAILWTGAGGLRAADATTALPWPVPRVRTADPRLQRLLDEGTRASPILRTLIERLEASDVIVYVQCEPAYKASRLDGRLVFAGAAGGVRYIVIRLAWLAHRHRQIAILAHELQHAVEIANASAVVDGPSLAREYGRIGFVSRRANPADVAFDTHAAVEAGERVLRELGGQ